MGTLSHRGDLKKNHIQNWVLARAEHMQQVDSDGLRAGLNNNYLRPAGRRITAAPGVTGAGVKSNITVGYITA